MPANITPSFLPFLYYFSLCFFYFYSLFCTFLYFSSFFQLSHHNTLNSMYNKDLHNFFASPRRYSSTHLLIYSFTLLCKTNPGSKLKDPPKTTQLNNQSSIITNQWKGEPNFKNTQIRKNAKRTQFHTKLWNLSAKGGNIYPHKAAFPQKYSKKCKKMRNLCNFLTLTHLTQCTTNTYKTFHQEKPLKTGVYPTSLWRKKIQNEPNSPSTIERRKMQNEPKSYVPQGTKTNPISTNTGVQVMREEKMQNKPNLQNKRT